MAASSNSRWRYDVFLSFSDDDEESIGSFIDDLNSALTHHKLNIYKRKSEVLQKREEIPSSVLRAIEDSRISIIVFSLSYAKSRWCLQEVRYIMECFGRNMSYVVVPVFYNVDPSQVRLQSGAFGEAFERLINSKLAEFRDEVNWRLALAQAAKLIGLDLEVRNGRSEGMVIKNITDSILKILDSSSHTFEVDHVVGLYSRMKKVIEFTSGRLNEVLILGIWGIGGIGKTTLAKAIYNKIGHHFECRGFLENVREFSEHDDGLVGLHEKFFSGIIYTEEGKICSINIQRGENIMKEMLHHKRVLLVLDDLSSIKQFEAFVGSRKWYGRGSKIIVTTTDKLLLKKIAADYKYEVKGINLNDSQKLFSWYAFKQASPKQDFAKFSSDSIEYCHGNPLSLKILGSYFAGRSKEEWKVATNKLKNVRFIGAQHQDEILKISYYGLSSLEKDIFLFISCFLIGKERDYVSSVGSELDIENGLTVLIEKGLVSIDETNKLRMHDLLQKMGREMLLEKTKHEWIYHVFLSFRGEETRSSFTSHLYAALANAGLKVFMDDGLQRGDDISSSLSQAIRCSRISLVIFSTSYAGSRWCLEELEKIMECQRTIGHIVMPVFYHVDPSEVRKQTGSFGKVFEKLLSRTWASPDTVLSWKRMLTETSNLSGWDTKNFRTEVELIDKILKTILETVDDGTYLSIANHPVGVKSRVQDVIPMLNGGSNDVCIIGIWGMRGIGKTTLAKAIYNEVGGNFDGKSFLANVREVWKQDKGLISLQGQLVSDILKMRRMRFHNVELGKVIIKEGLRHKKVLVVLDDVIHLDQLNALCGSREWFGRGSRLIITTTDKHLLDVLQVDYVHELKPMEKSESVELFSWHAFKKASPERDFMVLSRNIVTYSGGLPLALEVLGCYLFNRKIPEWESVLEKLKRIPNHDIQEKLKISFDGLNDDTEKEIFLDISCFFLGVDRKYAIQILSGCGFFAEIGISILIQRSLVSIDKKNKLRMHDLLRDMGREIIRKESTKFPEERSRLWLYEDVLDILKNHMGTKSIEGLALKLPETNEVILETKAFKKMKRLRLLQLGHVPLAGDYEYLPRNIRWLYWHGCPSKYIPGEFYMGSLVAADLKYSKLKVFWKKPQLLEKMKVLNLSHSCYFTKTPDFSKLPNLEELILKDCPSLSMVHSSIGDLNKLLIVNLKDCKSLNNLPRSFYKLKSLETLILSGCSEIDKLEEDIEQMESLTTLMADNTAITQAPFSIVRSKSIKYISLCDHEGSSTDVFPSLIWSWTSPRDNPESLIQASGNMSSLTSQIRSVRIKCQTAFHVRQDIARILDALDATNCAELETKPNVSQLSDMRTSALSNCHNQVQISGSHSFLSSLWIHMGGDIKAPEERILQGSTTSEFGDNFRLNDKYSNWLMFMGEGSSVLFKMPQVTGSSLMGMTLYIAYSSSLANMTSIHLRSVLIVNHTKSTIQIHEKEVLISPSLEEWKDMISDLEAGDKVEILVVFGHGFTVKKTNVYLIYSELVDEKTECSSSHSDKAINSSEEMPRQRKKKSLLKWFKRR